MMAAISPTCFSQNGEYLVHSSADGVIKIWETATGVLRQEYTPSSHLSATCTCLSWSPRRGTSESPRKKKKKKSGRRSSVVDELDFIAIGTTSGSVLLYSFINGDLHTQLEESHSDTVNDVCWSPSGEVLYGCSSDHHVTEWDVTSGKVKHKWKADKGSVYSVCCCSHQHLLSAGRSIKLWELTSRTVLQTFTGHSTEVIRLLPVQSVDTGGGGGDSVDNTYFMSAALNDRLINVWHINSSPRDKHAVASFSLPDEPNMVDISRPEDRDQPLFLSVVTISGQVLIFEHALNGKLKKPVKAKFTIQCASPGDKDRLPRPIPVLAASIQPDQQMNVLLAYGNFLKPVFEKVVCNSQKDICLIREDTTASAVRVDKSISKVKTPDVSSEVTNLIPGLLAPSKPTQDGATSAAKRKKRKTSATELSMEDRLSAISIDQSSAQKGVTTPPKADTLALLLTQGLQSQDKKIINNVLQNTNGTIIRNTVRRLPVVMIIPFVQELSNRMQGHAQSGHTIIKWVKTLMTVHTSYLLTFPELVETFSGLYQMMDSRVAMFSRLSKLQGKLDLVLSQITSQDQEEEEVSQQALLVYQDDSSDEDIAMDDLMPSHSESEDNWEDLSDMEAQDKNGEDSPDEE